MNRRQRRALARQVRGGRPSSPVVDAARENVERRILARIDRLDDPTVVLPPIDPAAEAVLRAEREARGGMTPAEAREILRGHLDQLEDDGP